MPSNCSLIPFRSKMQRQKGTQEMQEAKEEMQMEQEGSEEVQEDVQEVLDARYDENKDIIPHS